MYGCGRVGWFAARVTTTPTPPTILKTLQLSDLNSVRRATSIGLPHGRVPASDLSVSISAVAAVTRLPSRGALAVAADAAVAAAAGDE